MIINITHAAKECALTEGDLVSLLRIAYLASHKVLPNTSTTTDLAALSYLERSEELYHLPKGTLATGQILEPALHVATQSVLGPTTYTRLLTVLAQRKTLGIISKWKQLPKGSLLEFTCLEQVQQATRPETIRHFLGLATRRLTEFGDKGRRILELANPDGVDASDISRLPLSHRIKNQSGIRALFAFTDGAELGTALIAFDNATNSVYGASMVGARKEQV